MPHYLTQEIKSDGWIAVWKLTETEEELLSCRNLSAEETDYLSHLTNKRRRIEWLASRILLQKLLGQNIQIEYLPNGKPILTHPKYFLSISHSKDFVAVIISPNKNVGVDIEKIRDNIGALKDKFLSSKELKTIDTSDNLMLHLHWGAKEATYKIYSSYQPLFTEHLCLANVHFDTQTATGVFSKEDMYKTVEIAFRQVEDNLLVYCWETENAVEN